MTSDAKAKEPPVAEEAARKLIVPVAERVFGGPAVLNLRDDYDTGGVYWEVLVTLPDDCDPHAVVAKWDSWFSGVREAMPDAPFGAFCIDFAFVPPPPRP